MTYKAEFKNGFVKLTDDNNNLAYIPYRSIVKIDAKIVANTITATHPLFNANLSGSNIDISRRYDPANTTRISDCIGGSVSDLMFELCITVLQNTTYDVTLNSKEFSIFERYMNDICVIDRNI